MENGGEGGEWEWDVREESGNGRRVRSWEEEGWGRGMCLVVIIDTIIEVREETGTGSWRWVKSWKEGGGRGVRAYCCLFRWGWGRMPCH